MPAEKKVSVYFEYDAFIENEKREVIETYKAGSTKELPESSANFWIVRGKAVLASERDAAVKAEAAEEAEAKSNAAKATTKAGAERTASKPAAGSGS